jgi:molybdopterin-guanine dinucleotide biosynthesis protein B
MTTKDGTPVLGFAAFSGTGKTTLLEQIIQRLRQADYHVGVLKQSHHNVEVDTPGKDSFRLRKAGASQTLLSSPYRQVLIKESDTTIEPELDEILLMFDSQELDIILIEGFKYSAFTKIELQREALGKPLLYLKDDTIVALATDAMNQPHSVPVLDINNIETIVDFLLKNILQNE